MKARTVFKKEISMIKIFALNIPIGIYLHHQFKRT